MTGTRFLALAFGLTAVSASDYGEACVDHSWHKAGEKGKDCSWVGESPKNRCVVKDSDAVFAFERCEATCGCVAQRLSPTRDRIVRTRGESYLSRAIDRTQAWRLSPSGSEVSSRVWGGRSCGKECENDDWHKTGEKANDCEWVRRYMNRCSAKGGDGSYAYEHCRESCHSCMGPASAK